jgi:hypothetical protein
VTSPSMTSGSCDACVSPSRLVFCAFFHLAEEGRPSGHLRQPPPDRSRRNGRPGHSDETNPTTAASPDVETPTGPAPASPS